MARRGVEITQHGERQGLACIEHGRWLYHAGSGGARACPECGIRAGATVIGKVRKHNARVSRDR